MSMSSARTSCGWSVLGNDECQDITEVAGPATHWYERWPILVDETGAKLARHVGTGEHPHHSVNCCGSRDIDGHDIGSCVIAQPNRAMQHSRNDHVVNKVFVAKRELCSLISQGS